MITELCSPLADKHKMERFLRPDAPTVVSVYAPITFPPTGVLLFKQRDDGEIKMTRCLSGLATFVFKVSLLFLKKKIYIYLIIYLC